MYAFRDPFFSAILRLLSPTIAEEYAPTIAEEYARSDVA